MRAACGTACSDASLWAAAWCATGCCILICTLIIRVLFSRDLRGSAQRVVSDVPAEDWDAEASHKEESEPNEDLA